MDLPTLQIVLPVGISFYTFQTMSYSIDVYRRQCAGLRNS
jgi:D-alanyl-lipoteichoic acid acyltransferase DltB (MBOAT superfamily)